MKINIINFYKISRINTYTKFKKYPAFKGNNLNDTFEASIKQSENDANIKIGEEIKKYQDRIFILDREIRELKIYQDTTKTLFDKENSADFVDLLKYLTQDFIYAKEKNAEIEEVEKYLNSLFLDKTQKEKLIKYIKKYSDYKYDINPQTPLNSLKEYIKPVKEAMVEDLFEQELIFDKKLDIAVKDFLIKHPNLEIESQTLENIIKTIFEINRKNSLETDVYYEREIRKREIELEELEKKITDLENQMALFNNALKENPKMSPLYNPLLNNQEKKAMLIALKGCADETTIEQQCGSYTVKKLGEMGLIKYIPFKRYRLIDLTDPQTKEVLDMLISKKDTLKTTKTVATQYNLLPSDLDKLDLARVTLKAKADSQKPNLTFEFIDLSDEKTKNAIEKEAQRSERIKPKKSKYFYDEQKEAQESFIPIAQLEKLGYGTVPMLRKMIADNILTGKIEKKMTPEGLKTKTTVNLADIKNRRILTDIRDNNPYIITTGQYAKNMRILQKDLLEYIKNGEIDIIPQYIFKKDTDIALIDLRNPKNYEFQCRYLFEKLIKEKAKQRSENSIGQTTGFTKEDHKIFQSKILSAKMALVWYFSKNTVQNALELAKQYQVENLLVKDFDEEELTLEEKAKIENYFKDFRQNTQMEQLRDNFTKAQKMIDLFNKKDFNSIGNEHIIEILSRYLED